MDDPTVVQLLDRAISLVDRAIPVLAALAAALIAWLGSERIANKTLDGQRKLARDAALREHRHRLLDDILDRANGRLVLYKRMMGALQRDDHQTFVQLSRQIDDQGGTLGDLRFTGISDATVVNTINQWMTADMELRAYVWDTAVTAYRQHQRPDALEVMQQITPLIGNLVTAVGHLNRSAENYIYGD